MEILLGIEYKFSALLGIEQNYEIFTKALKKFGLKISLTLFCYIIIQISFMEQCTFWLEQGTLLDLDKETFRYPKI